MLPALTALLLAGLFAPFLSAQGTICGRVAETGFGEVQVYCIPNLSTLVPFAPDATMTQIWIRPKTEIAQAYYLILRYRFAGIPLTEHRMIWGGSLLATSFFMPTLEPTGIFIYQLSSGRTALIQ